MTYCGACGTANPSQHRFCANCGAALGSVQQAPQGSTPLAQGSTPLPQGPNPLPKVDWSRLVVGNWVGAARVAAAALIAATVPALVIGVLTAQSGRGVGSTLRGIATLMTSAVGSNVETVAVSTGLYPLLITFAALGAGALAFRREVRAYPRMGAALADGARASLIFGLALMLIALVFRGGRGLSHVRADAPSALFLGFAWLFLVVCVVCLLRRDWLPPWMQRVHDRSMAPLAGHAVVLLALPVAGVVAALAQFTGRGHLLGSGSAVDLFVHPQLRQEIGTLGGYLPNLGFYLLALGGGAEFGAHGGAYELSGSTGTHLATWADRQPVMWIAPVLTIGTLFAAAWVVARRSSDVSRIVGNLAVWVGSLLVVLPWLTHLSSLQLGANGGINAYLTIGPDALQTTLLLTVVAAACAAVVAHLHGALDLNRIRSVQSTPHDPPGDQN